MPDQLCPIINDFLCTYAQVKLDMSPAFWTCIKHLSEACKGDWGQPI